MSGEFVVNTPGGQVRLADLPLDVLAKMEKESGVQWLRLVLAPATTALSASVVYRACCEHLGVEPEELTARRIIEGDIFTEGDDDLPTMFEDGAPAPKAEGGTPTPGSSGEPDDSDGPPT